MVKLDCKIVCEKGYWFVELPFNAGIIDLGDSINDIIDTSDEFKYLNHRENGLSDDEICGEEQYNSEEINILRLKLFYVLTNDDSEDIKNEPNHSPQTKPNNMRESVVGGAQRRQGQQDKTGDTHSIKEKIKHEVHKDYEK